MHSHVYIFSINIKSSLRFGPSRCQYTNNYLQRNVCFPILTKKGESIVKREYHGHIHHVAWIFSKAFLLAISCNMCHQDFHFYYFMPKKDIFDVLSHTNSLLGKKDKNNMPIISVANDNRCSSNKKKSKL